MIHYHTHHHDYIQFSHKPNQERAIEISSRTQELTLRANEQSVVLDLESSPWSFSITLLELGEISEHTK